VTALQSPSSDTTGGDQDRKALRTVRSACVLCSQVCGVVLTVDDTRIVSVRGDATDPISQGYLCQKARKLDAYQSSPERLDTPLRRRSDGAYEPIDWATAEREIAERLSALVEAHGPSCFAFYGGGGQANHLGGAYGQSVLAAIGSNRYFNAQAQENTGEFWVNGRLFGNQTCHTSEDVANAEVVVLVGTNPWQSHTFPQARRRLNELAGDDARTLIVIDPVRTETADRADLHLRPHPGTDAQLLSALLRLLIDRGHVDDAFISTRVAGIDAVVDAVRSIDVDEALACCGVPIEAVSVVADRIGAAASVTVRDYMGVRHNVHSALNTYLTKLIAIVTGNMGKVGGLNLHSWMSPTMKHSPDGTNGDVVFSPVTGQMQIAGLFPPNTLPEEILTDHPERIRAMVVDSCNPAHTSAGTAAQQAAFDALELLVVVDVALSETALRAHYVLPALSQFEKWETVMFTPHFPNNVVKLRPPAFAASGERRTEQQIYTGLLRSLGKLPPEEELKPLRHMARHDRSALMGGLFELIGKNPDWFAVAPSILAETLGASLVESPSDSDADAIRDERIAATAALWFLSHQVAGRDADAMRRAGFDGDPSTQAEALFAAILETPAGVEFTRHEVDDMWRWITHPDGRIHVDIPELLDEIRTLDTTPPQHDPDYPFILAAGQRRAWNANAIIRRAEWRDADEHGALTVHPDDLVSLGIESGSTVTITSAVGSITTVAVADGREPCGHCSLPHGYGFAGDTPLASAANVLTDPGSRCRIAGTPHHKHTRVRLEPARRTIDM
jgi:anaerobic selenocysteine-containing dehydrogenase